MKESNRYDVIVVGAGVGGLTVAGLCAKKGLRTLLVEQCDRVGGRAMTFRGEEILFHGEKWYRSMLAKQYTWLPYCLPAMSEIISRRMLQGYTLDVGYHGVSLNGAGYFRDLDEILGSGVAMKGNVNSTYIGNEWYLDYHAGKFDERILQLIEKVHLPYKQFYSAGSGMSEADFDALEKVSVTQWCKEHGLYDNKTAFGMIHALSTLITTINDPDDISVGDIFRYMGTVIRPKFFSGKAKWPSGFAYGGIGRWPQAVAKRFVDLGGELKLDWRVEKILIDDGCVRGIAVKDETGLSRLIAADTVVSNIPIQDTFKAADRSAFPEDWPRRMENLYGYGSIAPYFGLNKLVLPEREWEVGVKDVCVIPRTEGFEHDVYMCWNIQSNSDPSCSPGGKHLFTAYAPVTEKEARNSELMVKASKLIMDYLERRYPGFQDSIDWALFPTSWKLEGVAKSKTQAGTLKAPVKAPGVSGLFFAGDTVKGYGVAMDCACAAGLICASEITGEDYGVH
ncbi:MAG: FAD-dependent oxidoreductase [Pseudomonadota bacterium]